MTKNLITTDKILTDLKSNCSNVQTVSELEQCKATYLGKSGVITKLFQEIKTIPTEQKAEYGKQLNLLKQSALKIITQHQHKLSKTNVNATAYDFSQPTPYEKTGSFHPIQQTLDRLINLFGHIGFDIKNGPEVENEHYNFECLNIPSHHPSRDMHDTFYLKSKNLLRTHTSPVQIREMLKQAPPIKFIAPGKVYRCDADISHSPVFHQIEGLYIDKHINFSHLKGCLEYVLRTLFGSDKKIRFRSSYFPFTEPSCEVDVEWNGKWLEILGAGMVHKNVFNAVNYDYEEFSGFAFGFGVERIAMLYYQINDIRLLYQNDYRFLKQFK